MAGGRALAPLSSSSLVAFRFGICSQSHFIGDLVRLTFGRPKPTIARAAKRRECYRLVGTFDFEVNRQDAKDVSYLSTAPPALQNSSRAM